MRYDKIIVFAFLCAGLVACGGDKKLAINVETAAPGTLLVEVAFLNHPPVIGALREADELLASYGNRLTVVRYDFDTEAGAGFARSMGLTGHVPLAIFIGGSMEIRLPDRTVRFYSFPQGKGTWMVESGSWTVQDLRAALDQGLAAIK